MAAVILLLLGFLIPAGPYTKAKGAVAPPKIRQLISCLPCGHQSVRTEERDPLCGEASDVYRAGPSARFANAFYEIYRGLGENLLWVFAVPWLIGLFHYFRFVQTGKEKYLMLAFIGLNIIFLVLRSASIDRGLSKRYMLPLICCTSFYISTGLDRLIWKITRKRPTEVASAREKRVWFYVLVITGLGICAAKLSKPIGIDKRSYRNAAKWLNENTPEHALVAVPDRRISFYAERNGLVYDGEIPQRGRYVVRIFKGKEQVPIDKEVPEAKQVFSIAGDDERSGAVIYDFGNYISESVSLVSYRCEKIADEKYRFSFLFDVRGGFENDWAIFFHAYVNDENIVFLPENRRQYKYDNWDFYPKPPTSAWSKNECLTITREISAKPIPYSLNLGFYTAEAGQHGRQINIGWVDLGNIEQSNAR